MKLNIKQYIGISLCAFLLGGTSPLWAHAKLVRSDPAARATLDHAPATLRLWFSERLEPAYSTAELHDDKDVVISAANAFVSASDGKLLMLELPPLHDGTFTVHYRVLSVDGHVVKSQFRFSVRAHKQ